MLYIQHADILTPRERFSNSAVLIEDDRIVAVGDITCPPSAERIDATGLILTPGFIDLQLNGGFGFDFTSDPRTIFQVAERLPEHGVTSFLPTLITSPLETVAEAQVALHRPPPDFRGATPLGLHLEGPFLNPAKRGAHDLAHLRRPSLEVINKWTWEAGVLLVTLAPELSAPNLDSIKCLRDQGVVVSAGHSAATFDQAIAAFDAGVTYATHLFNAMPTLEHRAPGLVGAALTDPRLTVGVIPDGVHLHPAIVKLIWQAKGPARFNIVTDAMAALGMPPGQYTLGRLTATVDETTARLADGRLAGSILRMDQAVRNLIAFTGCSIAEAVATVTSVPAQMLGLTDRGQIAPGHIADLVLLTSDLHIAKTIANGKVCYETKQFVTFV
jgi:N-acetylglucosamine-6-phosphate deacetylase